MAFKNSDNNYFKIGKVVGLNEANQPLHIVLEEYKDQSTRENTTEFDNKILHNVGVQLSAEDMGAFVAKIYTAIKHQEPYSEMTDV